MLWQAILNRPFIIKFFQTVAKLNCNTQKVPERVTSCEFLGLLTPNSPCLNCFNITHCNANTITGLWGTVPPSPPKPAFTCFKSTIETPEKRCKICSKLTKKTPEQHYCRHSDVLIVSYEQISNIILMFLLLTLKRQTPTETVIKVTTSKQLPVQVSHKSI